MKGGNADWQTKPSCAQVKEEGQRRERQEIYSILRTDNMVSTAGGNRWNCQYSCGMNGEIKLLSSFSATALR
jgi:hypothetical protein